GAAPASASAWPVVGVASANVHYAKTAHVWRLARHWDARFVNAGPFGHINADSGIGDWPYGQYLLASLHPAPTPALADEALWLRAGDWPNRVRRDPRFELKERAHRSRQPIRTYIPSGTRLTPELQTRSPRPHT